MVRLIVLLLAASAVDQPSTCEDDATRKWNTFAIHAKDYLDAKAGGVFDVKLRARMRKDFEAVMACQCF